MKMKQQREAVFNALKGFGEIEVLSIKKVATILITGSGLSSITVFGAVSKALTELLPEYPTIEVLKNSESHYLVVLSPAQDEVKKLQDFKDYVHDRLDKMGIEKDPESIHKAAGCRIGGRIDILEDQRRESIGTLRALIVAPDSPSVREKAHELIKKIPL